jgi:hypothetical protein
MNDKNDMLKPDDPLKKLFREAAMERAPESLIPNVMDTLEVKSTGLQSGKPLISALGWVLIGTVLTLLSLLSLPGARGGEGGRYLDPFSQWIESLQFPSVELSDIPEAAWLGVLAFGVYGLLQLFLIKRELDRHRLF